ncbi:MAG: hypothetical protein ACRDJP_13110 [Actinomycetota bacterium]
MIVVLLAMLMPADRVVAHSKRFPTFVAATWFTDEKLHGVVNALPEPCHTGRKVVVYRDGSVLGGAVSDAGHWEATLSMGPGDYRVVAPRRRFGRRSHRHVCERSEYKFNLTQEEFDAPPLWR